MTCAGDLGLYLADASLLDGSDGNASQHGSHLFRSAGPQRTGQVLYRPQRRGRHPSFICIRMYPPLKDRFVVGRQALCQHVDVGGHEREVAVAERVSARVPVGGTHLHLAADVGVAVQLGLTRACRSSITRVVSSMAAQRPRGIAFMKVGVGIGLEFISPPQRRP